MKKVMDSKKYEKCLKFLQKAHFATAKESVSNSEYLEELDYHEDQTNRNFTINCRTGFQKHGPTECPRIHHTEPKLGFRIIAVKSPPKCLKFEKCLLNNRKPRTVVFKLLHCHNKQSI